MPAFGQRGLTGRPRSKAKAKQSKAKARHIQHLRSCATAIASRLAPTLDLQQPQNSCTPLPLVGASLLAMGPAHPTSPQTDTPLSRASSLPQGKRGLTKNQVGSKAASLWLLILIWGAPLTTMAERRHWFVGNPAWMPG
ncbi:hypothetical protein F7R20_26970 [Pseudomonas brassicacearum subsp. brassicacearum]|nr:hypothetical protein F7R20_26970 [Pseudomonas brassicacearum subsp. brassicacearum]